MQSVPIDPRTKVQCQRTRRYIGTVHRTAGGIWNCPHCEDNEAYRQAELFDADICALLEDAIEVARQTFDKPDDGVPSLFFLGDEPETVYEADQGTVHIYLARDSSWLEHCYSGSHEAFHRACSPCIGGHWADEMLAVMFSLRYLRSIGLEEHALLNESALVLAALTCSTDELINGNPEEGPATYGRSLRIGQELTEEVGWDCLARLPGFTELGGSPGFESWRDALSPPVLEKVDKVLGR
jgi:hypothetical protein